MTHQTLTSGPLLDEILALEKKVWAALIAGDPVADGRMLSEDFLGVYPSGYSDKAGHCQQLENGPTMAAFSLSDTRLRVISEDAVLLSYRADYQPANSDAREVMFISSLWERQGDSWINTFSQDTPSA